MSDVTFPGLGLEFHLDRVAFHLGSWPVYWYGIIIAAGFLLAVLYCSRVSGRFGIKQDDIIDMLFFAVPLAIVGARLYYIVFYLDLFKNEDGSLNFGQMVRIWDGGLAIYGGVIAAVLTLLVFCKVHGIKFLAFGDLGVFGLLIGQMIGRWGNFMNVEAYGGPTSLPWRMGIYEYVDGVAQYVEVHPTFLYESLWNLAGFLLLSQIAKRWRKFDGQIFLSYFAWYGVGRGMIEGLRTDSLYFFHTPIRVSQVFGFVTAAVAIVLLIWNLGVRKHDPAQLWVNRQKDAGKPRRVALVYLEGDAAASAWAEQQKKRFAEGSYLEEYALPADTPGGELTELAASLRDRADLDEVLLWEKPAAR
ncbi:prolipoprotein diacylglyceryl transferase [Lawsonibacter celer]|uniref:prolipoprotein diacylglyceryl transferase n=1 Tax=Lawsonibacter celer TaxID=2986526 RepID=UPI00164821F2|nr:prolipoprotein diacylglyceryl transferase [Lawsonibacter celer]